MTLGEALMDMRTGALRETAEGMKWISAKDKIPEGDILAVIEHTSGFCFKIRDVAIVHPHEYWAFKDTIQTCAGADGENFYYGEITYWMPLPEPPEEEK